jgi:hypothetical protein
MSPNGLVQCRHIVPTLHSLRRRIELLVNLHTKLTQHAELRDDLRDLAFL